LFSWKESLFQPHKFFSLESNNVVEKIPDIIGLVNTRDSEYLGDNQILLDGDLTNIINYVNDLTHVFIDK